jgi:hypothetical protein
MYAKAHESIFTGMLACVSHSSQSFRAASVKWRSGPLTAATGSHLSPAQSSSRNSAHTVHLFLILITQAIAVPDARSILALEQLTSEVAERIRPFSGHLSEVELFSLASGMACIELKYRGLASPTLSERSRPNVLRLL